MNYAMRRCFLSPEFSQFKVESVAAAAAATSRIFVQLVDYAVWPRKRLAAAAEQQTCSIANCFLPCFCVFVCCVCRLSTCPHSTTHI